MRVRDLIAGRRPAVPFELFIAGGASRPVPTSLHRPWRST